MGSDNNGYDISFWDDENVVELIEVMIAQYMKVIYVIKSHMLKLNLCYVNFISSFLKNHIKSSMLLFSNCICIIPRKKIVTYQKEHK